MAQFHRREVIIALDNLCLDEDGVRFQRLVRRLLRQGSPWLIPHAQHKDVGSDATIITPTGEATVCISLNLTFSKLRDDIRKILTHKIPPPHKIYFCTAASISNAAFEKWKHEIGQGSDLVLILLEKTWIIDECLRPENAFIVAEELRPELPLTNKVGDGLLIGPLIALTSDETPIYTVQTTSSHDISLATWSTPPVKDQPEGVHVATLQGQESRVVRIAQGADPHCVVRGDEVYISWCYRPSEDKLWHFNMTRSDAQLSYKATHRICSLRNVSSAAEMILYRGDVVLAVPVYDGTSKKAVMHFFDVRGAEFTYLMVDWNTQSEFRTLVYGTDIILAVRFHNTLSIFRYNGKSWKVVWQAPSDKTGIKSGVWRFDVAVSATGQLFVAFETSRDFVLMIAVINLNSRATEQIRQVSLYGKFPALTCNGQAVLLSWAGCPALPVEFQQMAFASKAVFYELWIQAEQQIREQTERLLESRGESTRDKLITPDIWSPLWIATVNHAGQCINSYGPLGYGASSNWYIDIVCAEKTGLLAVLSGRNESSTALLVRQFSFS